MKQTASKVNKGSQSKILRNEQLKSKIGSKTSISYQTSQAIKQRKSNNQLFGKYLQRRNQQQYANSHSFVLSNSEIIANNQKQVSRNSTSPNIEMKITDIAQKDRERGLVFLNQPNISLIAEKPQGSSFMSEKNGDGSMDSMDRLIIGVTQFQIDENQIDSEQKMLQQYYRDKEKELEQQSDNIRDISNLNTSLQGKKKQGSSSGQNHYLKENLKNNNKNNLVHTNSPDSSSQKLNNSKNQKMQSQQIDIQNNSMNSEEMNFSRLRQQYQELIDRKKLFENVDDQQIEHEQQDWLKRQLQEQDVDLVQAVKQVSRNYKRQQYKLKSKKSKHKIHKNQEEKSLFLAKNYSNSFLQRSHSQGPSKKGLDKKQPVNITDFHNIRRNLLNDSSSPNKKQLLLVKKLQQGLKICRKVLTSKQAHSNSILFSTVLGSTQIDNNNSIRMLGVNLSEIHEERENVNNNSMQIEQENMIDRREIQQDLPGFVGLSAQLNRQDRGQVEFQEEQIQNRQGQVQALEQGQQQEQNNLEEMNLKQISKVFPRMQQKNNITLNKHNISVLTQNENSDSVMIILEKELKHNKKKFQNNSYDEVENDKENPIEIVQERDLQQNYERQEKKQQFLRDIENAAKPFEEQVSSQNLQQNDLQKLPPVPNNLRNTTSKNSQQNCILLLQELEKGGKSQKKAVEILETKLKQRQIWIKIQSKTDKWKQKQLKFLKKMKQILKNPNAQFSQDQLN